MSVFYKFSAVVILAGFLVGCATPPAEPTFGYQSDGSYKINPQEAAKACPLLTKDIMGEIPAIAANERRAVQGRVLSGALFVAGAAFGRAPISDFGREPAQNAKRLRARVDAYNAQLGVKNCSPLDIDDLIAKEKERQSAAEPAPEKVAP
ncbi:MAG: hypothetical protein LCH39_02255 [Proteobacteria bacterium]|nr:hypothetical protein [Pseudomonadota bacterium]